MNNLYEFGGSCNVIIRCNSERTIGRKVYKVNEPYTILEDVLVDLRYTTLNSESSAKTNIIASKESYPNLINIHRITLTEKINDLIATRDTIQTVGDTYASYADNGVLYLPCAVVPSSLFVYANNELFTDYTVDISQDKLIGNFNDDCQYLVFYDKQVSSPSFSMVTPHYGYFTLEIIGKGNTNKNSKDLYMKFPACSLMSPPTFNFISGDILNSPLQFQCIYKNQPLPYFNVQD